MSGRRGARAGFTLLEVLVAAVIAALALPMVFRGASEGAASIRSSAAAEAAMAVARSQLARLTDDVSEWPATTVGRDGAFAWQMHVTREQMASPGVGVLATLAHQGEVRAALFAVELEVTWSVGGRRHALHVTSRRLGFVAPPPETP